MLFIHNNQVGLIRGPANLRLLDFIRRTPLDLGKQEISVLLKHLARIPGAHELIWPADLGIAREIPPCNPILICALHTTRSQWISEDMVTAELEFAYGQTRVTSANPSSAFYDESRRVVVMRNLPAEAAFRQRLDDLEFRFRFIATGQRKLMLKADRFREAALILATEGWQVEGEGIPRYIPPGELKLQINSGIDWLDVDGEIQFGDQKVKLPALLQAVRRGDRFIELPGGRKGLLPQDQLRPLASIAQDKPDSDTLRFTPSQAALVDAICSTTPTALTDDRFRSLRNALQQGATVQPLDPPVGFVGELRHYQKEALGWFTFLRDQSFGGCLADDMGLGKTVQVLAMLEGRRQDRHEGKLRGPRPSLVVAPRSLIFNWIQEAAKFTPLLRVLDYSGASRSLDQIPEADLVLTTYGTLRRDAADLARTRFDCVILDEAQAIKNASTATAKSVRVLDAQHRLALSGTPVENHLGELISLFEFLNPGMLCSTHLAEDAVSGKAMDPDTARLLARAVRPFILRRTKQQVAPELPERTEQTLLVELERAQRHEYNELRNYYQRTLLGEVRMHGLSRMRFQVLEALLRLRQAACHPGLIEPSRINDSSAKLEAILEEISEVIEEGHKALVFSQFVGMLTILRKQLDARGITYEYLDGATADRQTHVERFQSDPACPLFLISLKAGGVGLNLTAAEYVFLLDPWWNPAVEAQAIDRAHRIGQTRQVFAYRLIAKDTVEEKVLDLQNRKRALADALIGTPDDQAPTESMSAADVELLLS
ncbi:MAG TPA: SNF2-related protein [Chloroflexota bacterium]|nr:SNF2-related protein [Chloroflexota bacterium]